MGQGFKVCYEHNLHLFKCLSYLLQSGCWNIGFGRLVVLRIYVALAVFQPYRDLEAGDNQSLKFKRRGRESNPGPQAKSLTTRPPPLPVILGT